MIYFTGDTHGEQERLSKHALKKLQHGDTLIVCGDFGYIWEDSAREQKYLDKLVKLGINICFLDGTHENFDLLDTYPVVLFCGGKAHRIRRNVFHLLRGQIYEIEGKRIFALGGGEPPENQMQSDEELGTNRPEIPTKNQMLEAVENLQNCAYQVDYIVTHEPPALIRDFLAVTEMDRREISALGAFLDELSKTVTFRHWYFGSLHTDKYISRSYTAVFKELCPALIGEILTE